MFTFTISFTEITLEETLTYFTDLSKGRVCMPVRIEIRLVISFESACHIVSAGIQVQTGKWVYKILFYPSI